MKTAKDAIFNDPPLHPTFFFNKLPNLKTCILPRPRLQQILDRSLDKKLTLVIAPPGTGKTIAVIDWLHNRSFQHAWLCFAERNNNDPAFFDHCLTAVLKAPQLQKHKKLLLVLDDYHLVTNPLIDKNLHLLLNQMPENMNIILISRFEPRLSLAKLRVENQLMEIRERELAFNVEEICSFFACRKITIDLDDACVLQSYTEGWITGICLASLSLKSDDHISRFVRNFQGNELIFNYFNEEVFQGYPRQMQDFMIMTSILNPLNVPLCDAVIGVNNSLHTLRKLLSRNAFIYPLDPQRFAYNYHPMFRSFLQELLVRHDDPLLPQKLHKKAAAWFEKHGYMEEAMHHYILSRNFDKAAAILEQQAPGMLCSGNLNTLLEVLSRMPESSIQDKYLLCLGYAWLLALRGQFPEAELWLKKVEGAIEPRGSEGSGKNSAEQLRGELACIKAYLAIVDKRDIFLCISEIQNAGRFIPGGSILLQHGVCFNQGQATLLGSSLGMYGRLHKTGIFYQRAYKNVAALGRADGYAEVLLGEIFYEKNDLKNALLFLSEGLEKAERTTNEGAMIPALYLLAKIKKARGNMEDALDILNEAAKKTGSADSSWLPLLSAMRVRFWLIKGDVAEVSNWMNGERPGILGKSDLSNMFLYLTLARVLVDRGKLEEAVFLLSKLLSLAEPQDFVNGVIEILILQALAFDKLGASDNALNTLQKALKLGETEGYLRIFADEGVALAPLLHKYLSWEAGRSCCRSDQVSLTYVKKILTLIGHNYPQLSQPLHRKIISEPLTEREYQVLKLLAEGLNNNEIAEILGISLPTVRTHTSNIYGKLSVRNRTQAVIKGYELKII